MTDSGYQRRCALCGALDADHAYAAPDDDRSWACPRCEAVRYLWEPVPAHRADDRRRAAG